MKEVIKRITSFSLICFLIFPAFVSATTDYQSRLNECFNANLSGTALTIHDYICIESDNKTELLDQIILDALFTPVDEKIESFLMSVDESVVESMENTTLIIDAISKNLGRDGIFYREFWDICHGKILNEKIQASSSSSIALSGFGASDGLQNSGLCMSLAETKLDIATRVAYDLIKINKGQYLADSRKIYQIQQRSKYNVLLDLMRDIGGFILRLAQGVSHWTPYPLQ